MMRPLGVLQKRLLLPFPLGFFKYVVSILDSVFKKAFFFSKKRM